MMTRSLRSSDNPDFDLDLSEIQPYSGSHLEAALSIRRAEKAGQLKRRRVDDRCAKHGLRNRKYGHLGLRLPDEDDDASGDFDPSEERRAIRRLARARAAARTASEDDDEDLSPPNPKRVRRDDDGRIVFKLDMPGIKTYLRSLQTPSSIVPAKHDPFSPFGRPQPPADASESPSRYFLIVSFVFWHHKNVSQVVDGRTDD
jgi:hypothetical protein